MTIGFILIIIPLLIMGHFFKKYLRKNELLGNAGVKLAYCVIAPLVAWFIAVAISWFLIDVLGINFGITYGQVFMSIMSWAVFSYLFVYFTIRDKSD
tara:strand:+ start:272 stop:562 length:291 start_codon:yes stop_codon:yes gene_type:complete